jgi:two-component system response regulator YesN
LYKVVVADDEKFIRQGLTNFINSANMGFNVVINFKDGSEVLEYLNSNDVDVVLTDIRMAKLSGIELAKWIHENKPHIKVIIISGYKEFEYANKAIQYNVKHYLLKPTNFTEVRKVFKELKKLMDFEFEKIKKHEEFITIFKKEFFVDLVMGALHNHDEIEKRFSLLDLKAGPDALPCCLMSIKLNFSIMTKKWEYGKEGLNNAFQNILEKQIDMIDIYQVHNGNTQILAFVIANKAIESKDFLDIVNRHILEIKEDIKQIIDIDADIAIEASFNSIFEVSNNGLFSIEQNNKELLIEKFKLLVYHINSSNSEEIFSMIDSFLDDISTLPIESIHGWVINMFSILYNKYEQTRGVDFLKIVENSKFDYNDVIKINKFEDIKIWCKNLIMEISKYLNGENKTSEDVIILSVKKYVEMNIDKDISLQDVSDQVFLSPMYFSRFFKKHTGERFSDYLVKIKMNYAIKLLEEGLTIEKISVRTGYSSGRYFTRMFKQYTGYTPKEYYRRVIKKEI